MTDTSGSFAVDTAVDHVQVAIPAGVEDIARGFYGNLLGLREIAKPANLLGRGGVWFQTGSLQLHLGVDARFTAATKAHVAFRVADIDAMRARLAAAGRPIRDDEPLPGYRRFYTEDPFGNRVEVLTPEVQERQPGCTPRGR